MDELADDRDEPASELRTAILRVEGEGNFAESGTYNTVRTYRLELIYADGLKITMLNKSQHKHGITFHGTES